MTREIQVQAKYDHIASLSRGTPMAALEELVWNALDADAREVRIDLVRNELDGLDAVRISDDGTGIDAEAIENTFGSLGGSWKGLTGKTAGFHRKLHGRHGRGRFKVFAIGGYVEWRTTCRRGEGLKSSVLTGDFERPGRFTVSDTEAGPMPGTEVYILNVRAASGALLSAETVVPLLAAKFALYLKAYPDVHIYYAGLPVTPVIVQKAVTRYNLHTKSGGEARLDVIEWRRRFPGAGRLVFCGSDGFALHDEAAGTRAASGFSFTAYLQAPRFDLLSEENALELEELHPEVRGYLDVARKTLRDHFRVRAAEQDESRVAEWIAEGSYPFKAEEQSATRAQFDAAVQDMRTRLEGFDGFSAEDRKYLFGLLKKATGRNDR